MTESEKSSYLTRRAGILEILHSLIGHWDLADGLSSLVESEFVTPEVIDGVEKMLREAIKTVKDSSLQKKLQDGVQRIEKMREAENIELSHERDTASHDIMSQFI